jgi:hypothetical protein
MTHFLPYGTKMLGQNPPTRGRPRRSTAPGFHLLALAALCRCRSVRHMADVLSEDLGRHIAHPTVAEWLRRDLPRLARPSIALRGSPSALAVSVAYLLFRREPARSIALARLLRREQYVVRVDRTAGEFTVLAEVIYVDRFSLDGIVERFEPDAVCEVTVRHDRLPKVLRQIGLDRRALPG